MLICCIVSSEDTWRAVKIRSRQLIYQIQQLNKNSVGSSGIEANLLLLQKIPFPFESLDGETNMSICRELSEESMNFWPQRLGTVCYSLKGTQTLPSSLNHPSCPPQNPAEQEKRVQLNPSISRLEEAFRMSPDLVKVHKKVKPFSPAIVMAMSYSSSNN